MEGLRFVQGKGVLREERRFSDYFDIERERERYSVRPEYIRKFGFAIPSEEAIQAIVKLSPILEVGAGCGYWSYELRRAGADIVATDPKKGCYSSLRPDNPDKGGWWPKTWVEVKKLEAKQAIKKYPGRTLLTIWPDFKLSWPSKMLRAYTGPCVAYVGEGTYGCTGDQKFHDLLYEQWRREEEIRIPQFDGIHDSLTIYRRKTA